MEMYTGRIVKALAGFYYVKRHADGVVYACRAKGIFRKRNHSPLVGDIADFVVTHEGDKEGNIERLHERKSVLSRPTVANVDLALVVFALKDPKPTLHLLDRMLVVLEQAKLAVVLCFNKTDLVEEDDWRRLRDIYEPLGYPVLVTCAKQGIGKDALLSHMAGHLATVVGPSGAGKSSLINMLRGETAMEVGAVSDKIRRGKQTTRHVELVEIAVPKEGGAGQQGQAFIVDTPGFSSLEFSGMEKEDLGLYFPEIRKRIGACKYASCSHIHEPEETCVVLKAVEHGEISAERYESYKLFYEELEQQKRY